MSCVFQRLHVARGTVQADLGDPHREAESGSTRHALRNDEARQQYVYISARAFLNAPRLTGVEQCQGSETLACGPMNADEGLHRPLKDLINLSRRC